MTTASQGDECLITFDGQPVPQQLDEAAWTQRISNVQGRTIVLRPDRSTSYRCLGGAIFILHRSGAPFQTIDSAGRVQ